MPAWVTNLYCSSSLYNDCVILVQQAGSERAQGHKAMLIRVQRPLYSAEEINFSIYYGSRPRRWQQTESLR